MKRFCKTCGAEIDEGTNVCSICGSVFGDPQENETTVLNSGMGFGINNQNPLTNSAPQKQYTNRNNQLDNRVKNQYFQSQNPLNGKYAKNQSSQFGNNEGRKLENANNSPYYTSPSASNPYSQGNNYNNTNYSNPYQYSNSYNCNPLPPKKKSGTAVAIIMGIATGVVVLIAVIGIIIATLDSSIATQTENTTDSSYFGEVNESEEIVINYGTVSGTNYTNPTMGLSFDLPSSDWQFLTNQQIYDNSYGYITGANVYFDETNHVCAENATETMHFDSYAVNSISASLIYTFYSEPSKLAGDVDIDDYLLNNANADITSDSPYYATEDDIYSYIIADEEYRLCDTVLEINGVTFNTTFACRQVGDYICGIVVINSPEYDSNSTFEYMDMFY